MPPLYNSLPPVTDDYLIFDVTLSVNIDSSERLYGFSFLSHVLLHIANSCKYMSIVKTHETLIMQNYDKITRLC